MRFFKVIIYLLTGLALAGCFSTNVPFLSSDSTEESSPQPMLEASEPVASYPFRGRWLDIGRPDDFMAAQTEIARSKARYL